MTSLKLSQAAPAAGPPPSSRGPGPSAVTVTRAAARPGRWRLSAAASPSHGESGPGQVPPAVTRNPSLPAGQADSELYRLRGSTALSAATESQFQVKSQASHGLFKPLPAAAAAPPHSAALASPGQSQSLSFRV